MKCRKCQHSVVEEDVVICKKEIGEQGIVCLLKNILRVNSYTASTLESQFKNIIQIYESMSNKFKDDLDEGEEWKK